MVDFLKEAQAKLMARPPYQVLKARLLNAQVTGIVVRKL